MNETDHPIFPDITDDDIRRAIARAHALRSEYIATWGGSAFRWVRSQLRAPFRSTSPTAKERRAVPRARPADAGVNPLLPDGPGAGGKLAGERPH